MCCKILPFFYCKIHTCQLHAHTWPHNTLSCVLMSYLSSTVYIVASFFAFCKDHNKTQIRNQSSWNLTHLKGYKHASQYQFWWEFKFLELWLIICIKQDWNSIQISPFKENNCSAGRFAFVGVPRLVVWKELK